MKLKDDAKFEEKLTCGLKIAWGIWQIFTRALERLKIGLWSDSLIQSRKSMSLNFTEELCLMAMKNDAKFEEKFTCHFKIDVRNLTNFDPNTWKSQAFSF